MRNSRWTWLIAAAMAMGCQGVARSNANDPVASPPGLHVTGRPLVFAGASGVPIGRFGVDAMRLTSEVVKDWGIESVRTVTTGPTGVPLNPGDKGPQGPIPPEIAMIVETWYDRYQPALLLTDPSGWQSKLEALGRTYAENAKKAGGARYVEFWNEPFINWAGKPGVNYDGEFYDQSSAADGQPMTIRGQSQPTPHMIWTRGRKAVNAANNRTDYLASRYLPATAADGEEFTFRGRKFRVVECWRGQDRAQQQY